MLNVHITERTSAQFNATEAIQEIICCGPAIYNIQCFPAQAEPVPPEQQNGTSLVQSVGV